jgi:hypothetical protein
MESWFHGRSKGFIAFENGASAQEQVNHRINRTHISRVGSNGVMEGQSEALDKIGDHSLNM